LNNDLKRLSSSSNSQINVKQKATIKPSQLNKVDLIKIIENKGIIELVPALTQRSRFSMPKGK